MPGTPEATQEIQYQTGAFDDRTSSGFNNNQEIAQSLVSEMQDYVNDLLNET